MAGTPVPARTRDERAGVWGSHPCRNRCPDYGERLLGEISRQLGGSLPYVLGAPTTKTSVCLSMALPVGLGLGFPIQRRFPVHVDHCGLSSGRGNVMKTRMRYLVTGDSRATVRRRRLKDAMADSKPRDVLRIDPMAGNRSLEPFVFGPPSRQTIRVKIRKLLQVGDGGPSSTRHQTDVIQGNVLNRTIRMPYKDQRRVLSAPSRVCRDVAECETAHRPSRSERCRGIDAGALRGQR